MQTCAFLAYVGTGWYMLEIRASSCSLRTKMDLMLANSSGSCEKAFQFHVYRGLLAKRLIRVDHGGALHIRQETGKPEVVISTFRLVRFSQKFAASRMLTKLKALHPFYNPAAAGYGATDLPICKSAKAVQLWSSYDTLFNGGANLFPYSSWLKAFPPRSPTRVERGGRVRALDKPRFSVVLPTFRPSIPWITQAIYSVLNQRFQDWELVVVDDGSGDVDLQRVLSSFSNQDSRIQFHPNVENRHISAASNCGLEHSSGEWIVFLDHDDLLDEYALYHVDRVISTSQDCALIYSDVDKVDDEGVQSEPYFKPDWNYDLFLSQNLFSHLGAYRADLLKAVGGFRVGYEGAQDYDLALRCTERIRPDQIVHIPRVLYHWRMHADSTAYTADAKPYAMIAGERALNDHFERQSIKAKAESMGYGYRVRYALPAILPLVSLIIPTRNRFKLLQQCVESIFQKTTYPNYELIIIDNGSDDRATLRYLDVLEARPGVRVIRDAQPFNYSALNNAAVKLARGEVVGLINNDVEVISPDWLGEMVSHALRPEVGAVGARLWYSDDTLQHAGVVLGIHGVAGHVHRFLPRGNVGYCGRAALIQSFSAVTGACLVVRKSSYEAVGGLNEVELQVACNDIDFCLKLREAGYRNIYTPYAELYHHESASRGLDDTTEKQARSAKEVAYMKQRWGDLLLNDPAYSPNLSLDAEDFSLAWPPRIPGLVDNEALAA
jgi:O-antigen biosynthesis protein